MEKDPSFSKIFPQSRVIYGSKEEYPLDNRK